MIYTGGPTWAYIKTLLLHVDEVGFCWMNRWFFTLCMELLWNNKKIMVMCFLHPPSDGRIWRFSWSELQLISFLSSLFNYYFFGFFFRDRPNDTTQNLWYACVYHLTFLCIWFLRLQVDWASRKKCVLDLSLWFYVEEESVKMVRCLSWLQLSISLPWNPAL